MSTVHINLSKKLKSFKAADTNSESKGFVQAGSYAVLDSKPNYPNSDTDYTKIEVKGLGLVWICSRWKDSNYAEVKASPQPQEAPDLLKSTNVKSNGEAVSVGNVLSRISFNNSNEAIEESTLIKELKAFDGFSYDLKNPTYPHELKGINVPMAPPNQNNCCTFVEGVLVKSWSDKFSEFDWNNKRHGQMMIYSTDDYFSPITALVENEMGDEVEDLDVAPQPWTAVQGWKTKWSGGHTFLIVDHHKESDKVLTLESNKAYKLNGVGFRQIGMASNFDHKPPESWWEIPAVWTWEKLKSVYKFRGMATLKVKNRSWSGLD